MDYSKAEYEKRGENHGTTFCGENVPQVLFLKAFWDEIAPLLETPSGQEMLRQAKAEQTAQRIAVLQAELALLVSSP